jgi:hypothetical protein
MLTIVVLARLALWRFAMPLAKPLPDGGVEAGSSGAKFAEQGLRVFQVGGTEAFSEARVKRG